MGIVLPFSAYSDNLSVVIAFTNHALDHLLTSILDAKITTSIMRLGSKTTDERIAQYSLNKLEQLARHEELDRPRRRQYAIMKEVEEQMTRTMNNIQLNRLTSEDAEKYLDFHYPQHADSLRDPPFWIAEVLRKATEDKNENGEWIKVSKGKKSTLELEMTGKYGFWRSAGDIEFIRAGSQQAFFDELGFSGQTPKIPSGHRPIERLAESSANIWSMSISERKSLAELWEEEMRRTAYESNLAEFGELKQRFKEACKTYEDVQDEVCRSKRPP